jgi:hypothetical protein
MSDSIRLRTIGFLDPENMGIAINIAFLYSTSRDLITSGLATAVLDLQLPSYVGQYPLQHHWIP